MAPYSLLSWLTLPFSVTHERKKKGTKSNAKVRAGDKSSIWQIVHSTITLSSSGSRPGTSFGHFSFEIFAFISQK